MTTIKINSQSPYFDDFDESKNFSKILFKPGYAVQARELTQLQTIIQNQIARFGEHVFTEGSIVSNGKTQLQRMMYITATVPANLYIVDGDELLGATSGATAKVAHIEKGATSSIIWVVPSNGISFDFTEGVIVLNKGPIEFSTIEFAITTPYSFGYAFSIEPSVFFARGVFVYIGAEKLFIKEDAISARLGLTISESITTFSTDNTLLDPATGSYNFSAPGADRQTISLALDSKPFTEFSDNIDDLSSDNFIELIRVSNGKILKIIKYSDYSNIGDTLARRTYDESGDYTVEPFFGSIRSKPITMADVELEPTFNEDNLPEVVLNLTPGKAYVKGYEFETTADTGVLVKKARTFNTVSGAAAYYDYQKYVYVKLVTGDPDLMSSRLVSFRNSLNDVIGTAYATGLEYDSTAIGVVTYKLNLANIKFIGNATIGTAVTVTNSATPVPFAATIDLAKYTASIPTIGSSYNSLPFVTLPNSYVKSLLTLGSADTVWDAYKLFNVTLTGAASVTTGTATNATTNQDFVGTGVMTKAVTDRYFLATVITNSGTGPAAGTILTYDNGLRVSVTSSSIISVSYDNATNFGTGGGNNIAVYARVSCRNWLQRSKTLTTTTVVHNTPYDTTVKLNKADGHKLTSIIATFSGAITSDVTDNYTFNGGQLDDIYDLASITATEVLPVSALSLTITYEYFDHTGQGFFSVDSYQGMNYSEIPEYKATNGKTYRLADVLDFRQTVSTASTTTSNIFPVVAEDMNFDYSYYLGRKDKLVINSQKQFKVIEGMPSETPAYPEEPDNSMVLYYIDVTPYTFAPKDVKLKYVDNSRYTMKDIAKLENRIDAIEYYTALSLLEKQAQEAKIASSTPGLDKFKSGILVDPFNDHAVGDTANEDYKCSIDFENRELRAQFKKYPHQFKLTDNTNTVLNEYLVMLPHTETEIISQKLASGTRNLNPNESTSWMGNLVITPNSNSWVEKGTTLEIYVTKSAAGVYAIQDGTRWNDWKAEIAGLDASAKVVSSTATSIVKKTTTKIVDTTNVTFMKAETISFVATGLLPSVNTFVTVNDVMFQTHRYVELQFATPVPPTAATVQFNSKTGTIANAHQEVVFISTESEEFTAGDLCVFKSKDGAVLGTSTLVTRIVSQNLETNKYGVVCGVFSVPSNTVLSGNVRIIISNTVYGIGTCAANAIFVASGIISIDANITITTTVVPKPVEPPVTPTTPDEPTTPDNPTTPTPTPTEPPTGSMGVIKVISSTGAVLKSPVWGKPYSISAEGISYKQRIDWPKLYTSTTDSDSYDLFMHAPASSKTQINYIPFATNGSTGDGIAIGQGGDLFVGSESIVISTSVSRKKLSATNIKYQTFFDIKVTGMPAFVATMDTTQRLNYFTSLANSFANRPLFEPYLQYPAAVNGMLSGTTTLPDTTGGGDVTTPDPDSPQVTGSGYGVTNWGIGNGKTFDYATTIKAVGAVSDHTWESDTTIWEGTTYNNMIISKGTSTNPIVVELWLHNSPGWDGQYGLSSTGYGGGASTRKFWNLTIAQTSFVDGMYTAFLPKASVYSRLVMWAPNFPPATVGGSTYVIRGYITAKVYENTNPGGAVTYTSGLITIYGK